MSQIVRVRGREWVARKVVEMLGGKEIELVHNHHNFTWHEEHEGDDAVIVRGAGTKWIRTRTDMRTMRKWLVPVSALFIFLAACEMGAPARVQAPADSASGEVEFTLAGPNDAAMVVPVRINGREPVDFIVDTGATLTH